MPRALTDALNPPEPDEAARARAAAQVRALSAIAFIASAADNGSGIEAWVGYESLHPLTWLPAQDGIGLA